MVAIFCRYCDLACGTNLAEWADMLAQPKFFAYLVGGLAAVIASSPSASLADTIGGQTATVELALPDGEDGFQLTTNQEDIAKFFNLARCTCPDTEFSARMQLPAGDSTEVIDAEVWVGTSCDTAVDLEAREQQCENPYEFQDIVDDLRTEADYPISVSALMFPNTTACEFEEESRQVYLLVDDDNENDNVWQCTFAMATEIFIDTLAPPEPLNPVATPAEQGISIDWEAPESRSSDVDHYQVLCQRTGEANAADNFPRADPEYILGLDLCGVSDGTMIGSGADDFETLDPQYICGTATGTDTSIRISGLENGVEYRVALIVVDQAGNATPLDLGAVTPQEVRDFWEDLHDKDGDIDGGICLVTSTFGDDNLFTTVLRDFRDGTLAQTAWGRAFIAWYYDNIAGAGTVVQDSLVLRVVVGTALLPVVAAAAFWEYTVWYHKLFALMLLVLWRRRRRSNEFAGSRPALVAASTVLCLASVSATSYAQQFSPYWNDYEDQEDTDDGFQPDLTKWNLSFKVGQYIPRIDDGNFVLEQGELPPYEATFGNDKSWMGTLEVERFLLYPLGQLGITGSIGYMGAKAHAFALDAGGNLIPNGSGGFERSAGDKTAFRMVPMSLGVVYRFTHLDDRWKIPVVPYAKAALSYYLWWVAAPDGSVAEVPTAACPDLGGDCDGNRALGASLGMQATFGIALRLERLDKQAAVNLRQQGIEHISIFAEVMVNDVDHFGGDGRLNVGDNTWFAGLSFEF